MLHDPEVGKIQIWASLGITKNVGNYESVRIDAGGKVYADGLDDEKTWQSLWQSIDGQIAAQVEELESAMRSSKKD